ncbi:MAG: hypothetical protein GY822_25160 [Deltaproteobacteria bacterium]|nr:hypothetical protein [Deltaproteobacteria bacterium]
MSQRDRIRPRSRVALLCIFSASLLAGCASSRTSWRSFPSSDVELTKSETNAEVERLSEQIYGTWQDGSFALLDTQMSAALQKHPKSARVHEMAGYVARLNGDAHGAWRHFLEAVKDTSSDVTRLHLYEMLQGPLLVSQTVETLSVMAELAASHPDPLIRHQARRLQISFLHRLGRLDEAKHATQKLDVMNDFLLLGAFDNDQGKGFLSTFPPEEKVDATQNYDGRRVKIQWRPAIPEVFGGGISFGSQVSPSSNSVAYLATWVIVEQDTDAVLRLSTRTPTKAFVNGAEILSVQTLQGIAPDNLNATINLKKGANLLLLKSAHKNGRWALITRITDKTGRKIPGLSTTIAPQATPLAHERHAPSNQLLPVSLFGDDVKLKHSARALFLKSRALRMNGFHRDASKILDEGVSKSQGNLLTLYERALLFWDTDENGKAIDLLNAGVEVSKGQAEAFLMKRARFYRGKKQWGKAFTDLRQVLKQMPNSFAAHMAFGALFDDRGWDIDRCKQFKSTFDKWPSSAYALREWARCLDSRGYDLDAKEAFANALALEPGHVWNLRRMGDIAIGENNFDEAWSYQERLLELRPTSGSTKLRAADLLRRMHKLDAAKEYLGRARAQDPDWARPLQRSGDLAYEADDVEMATDFWRASLDRDPDDTHLADLMDFISPSGLGRIEKYIPSDERIASAIQKSRSLTPSAGANVVFLMDHEVTEVQQDGSAKAVVTLVQWAVNKIGRDALIKKGIPTHGKVKLRAAYSVSPDGSTQEASSIRGGSLRYRNVELGSVTVLQYVHYRPPPAFLPNHYVAQWFFEGIHQQYNDSTWVLITPEERFLHIDKHEAIDLVTTKDGPSTVRTFRRQSVAPLIPERGMPPLIDILASVSVSTVEGWEEYVKWERALLTNAFTSNPELEELAKKLVKGATTTREKFDRLFHYVAQEIRYQQDYESSIAGVRPHSCPQVLARGYGDCKDKAVLLILLAKHSGVDVDFAILRTTGAGRVKKDVPNQQFNHAIVYVPKQEGIESPFFMDPTTDGLDIGNLRADDQGAISLVLDPDTGEYAFQEIPMQGHELDFEKHNIVINVDKDLKATATDQLTLKGRWAAGVRRLVRDDESARKLYERLSSILFPGATLLKGNAHESENTWKPLALSLEIDVTNSVQPQGDQRRLGVPYHFPLTQSAQSTTRKYPLRLGIYGHAETRVEVNLPPGAKTSFVPPNFKTVHRCFELERKTQEKRVKGTVVVSMTFSYQQRCFEVTPEEYVSYRSAVQEAISHLQDRLSFEPSSSTLAFSR